MSGPAVRDVTTPDGTRLAVHVLGDGPPLLCLPGGPGRASAYLEDLGGLSRSSTLLRLDLRGTGLSELPADRSSLEFPRLADDVVAVCDTFGLERVDLLGHSAGCHVALAAALRHRERLDRLVLVTPSARGLADAEDDVPRIRESRRTEPWYAEVAALEQEIQLLPPDRRDRADRGLRPFFYGRWDDRAQAHAASTDSQMSMRAGAAFVPESLDDQEMRAGLARMDAPSLVVVGDRDGLTGVVAGEVLASVLPRAMVVTLARAGHYPWVDEPEAFLAVVERFLAGSDGSGPSPGRPMHRE